MKRAALLLIGILVPSIAMAGPAPRLDGFLNDPFWSSEARAWTLFDPARPDSGARCYLGYDDQCLYFAASVSDTNVVGTARTPKSKAWEDDSVRLLLHVGDRAAAQWTADTFSYTFSATGGATWSRGPITAPPDKALEAGWPPSWNSAMTWATVLRAGTTPNVSGNRDTGYSVEARIPWSELGIRPPFKPGATLGVCILNICRPEASIPGGKPLSSVMTAREIQPANPSLWQRLRMDWQGPLAIRGQVEPLPLQLGSPAPEYLPFAASQSDPQGPWWNRSAWTARFEQMRSQNLNTLALRHSHPWLGLLPGTADGQRPDTRPAGSPAETVGRGPWFDTEQTRVAEQFRWILTEARRNGVRVFLLLESGTADFEPAPATRPVPGSVPAAAASQPATAPEIAAEALGRRVIGLLQAYPDLAGIAAGAGFNAPPLLEELAGRLAALPAAPGSQPAGRRSGPDLLVWTNGIEPATARRIIDRYPRTQLLHPLQERQWFKPVADPRIARFAAQVDQLPPGPAPDPVVNIAVGSLRGAADYVFWGDPQWARCLMCDIRCQGIQGFLLDGGTGEHWLGREALFNYAYNAGQRYSPQLWESRLRVLGVDQYAAPLLEAAQHASAVMPKVLLLMHDPSGRFMPQFGLLLAEFAALPTNSPSPEDLAVPGQRAGTLELGPAWPEAMWDHPIASLRDEAAKSVPPDSLSPLQVISDLGRNVDACKGLLPGLRHLEIKNAQQAADLNRLLDAIEMNVLIGEHYREKFSAAIGWEQYKARRGRAVDCTRPLQQSVEAWKKAAEIARRLYPAAVPFWQLQAVSPPPWSAGWLHDHYVPVTGHWHDQVRRFEREVNLILTAEPEGEFLTHLPLWDLVNAAPEEKRQNRYIFDFEHADTRYQLFAGARVEKTEQAPLAGKASLIVDTRPLGPGRHEVLLTDAGRIPFLTLQKYQVSIIYKVIDPGPDRPGPGAFEIGVRTGKDTRRMGDHPDWTAPAGYAGIRVLQVPPPDQDGNFFYIATNRPAAIVIDSVLISQIVE